MARKQNGQQRTPEQERLLAKLHAGLTQELLANLNRATSLPPDERPLLP